MEQLSLFEKSLEDGVIIPKTVVSPVESTKSIKSKDFKVQQLTFSKYIKAIQSYHKCSFFEARNLFFEHRDEEKPIHIDFEYFF